jgi:hypothetical protein
MSEQDIINRLNDMERQATNRHKEVITKLAAIDRNLIDQSGRTGLNVVLDELRSIKRTLST